MNWRKIGVGVGIGVGLGLLAVVLKKKCCEKYLHPDDALVIAKDVLSRYGEISGSWIHTAHEEYDGLEVYHGGVTIKKEGDQHTPYEFILDAASGVVVYAGEVKRAE